LTPISSATALREIRGDGEYPGIDLWNWAASFETSEAGVGERQLLAPALVYKGLRLIEVIVITARESEKKEMVPWIKRDSCL